jgi:HTH-type transcriptional regulator, global nitrogen regulator NrpRI
VKAMDAESFASDGDLSQGRRGVKPTRAENERWILKALQRMDRPAGATQVAQMLGGWGVALSERSVRLYLLEMDRQGLTQLATRRLGRTLTARGRAELERCGVIERMAFIAGHIDELNYRMGFSLRAGRGTLVVNTTLLTARDEVAALDVARPVFAAGLGMGSRLLLLRAGATYDANRKHAVLPGQIAVATICSVSLNGILLKEGIPVTSRFGGLLEFKNHVPQRFVELLAYGGTTLDPLELFIRAKMTSVRKCAQTGSGVVGASFREFPSVALGDVLKIRESLRLLGLDGILAVGAPNQPLFGIPVGEGRTGLVVLGGLNPAAALEEAGIPSESRSLAGLLEYRQFPEFRHLNMCARRGE